MKILYSCLSRSWGGLEMRTIQGAEELHNRNVEVNILCFPHSQINLEAVKREISCITIKASGYFHPILTLKLAKILKSSAYDLVHTQFSKDLWIIVPALKYASSNIPLILTKRMGSLVAKRDILHKWLYNRVNYVLAISNVIKKNVLETCPVPENKVSLHYNGVDFKNYKLKDNNRNKIRNELNIRTDEIVIGMMSRISYGKGHEELLQAARNLCSEYSNLKFLLVGNSSSDERNYEDQIKSLSTQYHLNDKIIFTGFRKDTIDMLSAMDIFAFPSRAESFGSSLVEAMTMEKPSVGTSSDGVLDIIVDGVTGYLFHKEDSDDLTKKLKLLIDSPAKRIEMGKAARQRVIENFDLEKQTQKLIEFYQQVVAYA